MRLLLMTVAVMMCSTEALAIDAARCASVTPAPHARAAAPVRGDGALAALSEANRLARQRPGRDGFSSARQIYVWAPGALYELNTSPDFVSAILLEPGETLVQAAAGDTSRWSLIETGAEGSVEERTIVLVRPSAGALRTNIVLVTDRRTYLIEAVSRAGEIYAAEIAWCYAAPASAETAPVQSLSSDYRIRVVRGVRPAWMPVGVSDNGRRTVIEFPAAIDATSMPPLFVVTAEGDALVNYRVEGRRYVVDQVFDRAELRLASARGTVVRIDRVGDAHPVRSPRRRRP